MKNYVLYMTLTLGVLTAQAQQVWTLEQCMEYAMQHNTEIAQRTTDQQRREVQLQASKDARLPTFRSNIQEDLSMGLNTNLMIKDNLALTFFEVTGSMPLYTGSKLTSQIKSDKFDLLAAQENLHNAEKNLKVNVASCYLQVLYNKGEADIARKRLEVSQSMLQRAKSLYDKGKCPESDVAEAEATVSNDESQLTSSEADITLAKLQLTQLLNLPASEDFDVAEITGDVMEQLLPSPLALYAQVENTYPSIKSAGYNIAKAEQDIRVARSGYYPSLTLDTYFRDYYYGVFTGGNPGFGQQVKDFYNLGVSLKLSIPVFDAFSTRNRIRRAKIDLTDARTQLDDRKLELRENIEKAYYKALTAQKKYAAEVKSETANSISYRYVEKKYESGRSTLFDINQSQQQWFSASKNALRAKYEFLIRKKILDIYME